MTNGDFHGRTFQIPCNHSTTFNDLHSKLLKKFGNKDIILYLEGAGRQSLCDHSLLATGSELVLKSIVPSFKIPISVTDYGNEISLRLKSIVNDSTLIRIHRTDTIEVLKALIADCLGISKEEQVLNFAGKFSSPANGDTIASLKIHDYCNVDVSLRVKGGAGMISSNAINMPDVFNENAQRDQQFHPAPAWRLVSRGFNVEGLCKTRGCDASNRMVMCEKSFGTFDISKTSAHCPICKNGIQMMNFGFVSCFYSIRGVPSDGSGEKIIPWTQVGNYVRTWDLKEAGTKSWNFMQVVARQLERSVTVPGNGSMKQAPLSLECSICFKDIAISDSTCMLQCGHSFHRDCMENWRSRQTGNGLKPFCPLCHAAITDF